MLQLARNPNKLEVYSETKQSRIFVGTLSYNPEASTYVFEYDKKYLASASAIPLGPDLSLRKRLHQSKNELFSSLADRIPSRSNPAFEEYCRSQGISPKEKNPIILLATIGKRGPSTFIFESIYSETNVRETLIAFRKSLSLSIREVAMAFDLNYPTLNRIETRKSTDKNTLRILEIVFTFPEAALWAVRKNERKLHHDVAQKLIAYFSDLGFKNRNQLSFFKTEPK
jgi:transcriptional regulator with XRE-family HTH domain